MSEVRLDHIALAVSRLAEAPAFLVGVLGGTPVFGATAPAYRFGHWRFAGGGRLEILEPAGRDGFLHRFLARHGPGVHHVTFKVPSLRAACRGAEEHGYQIVGYDDSNPVWQEAFLHPRQALGIVVQLAESSGAGGAAPSIGLPPGPPDPPPPVKVVGLRLRARSRQRAVVQWHHVLQGQAGEEADGMLIYRWPHSALRLAVEIDADQDEGPIAIEVTSDRAISLPDGEHPVFGVVFRAVP